MDKNELNAALGRALGVKPEKKMVCSDDGGRSMCAWVDPIDGPWYSGGELRDWLLDEHSHGRREKFKLVYVEVWPRYCSSRR